MRVYYCTVRFSRMYVAYCITVIEVLAKRSAGYVSFSANKIMFKRTRSLSNASL